MGKQLSRLGGVAWLALALVAASASCGSDDKAKGAREGGAGESGEGGAGALAGAPGVAGAVAANAGAGAEPSGGTGEGGAAGAHAEQTPILVLQRAPRAVVGGLFDPESYAPGARILRLSDIDADARATVVCCEDALFDGLDISSFDVSFDGTQIVFAGKRSVAQRWALYLASLDGGAVVQVSTDATHDYFDPIFLPGGRIAFATTRPNENDVTYRDEVTRGLVSRLGTMKLDGSEEQLAAANLASRRRPTLMADGRLLFEQWDALGALSSGNLLLTSPDSAGGLGPVREAFGKEGHGLAAAHWNAREIAPGRLVAIAGPLRGTFGAGTLVELRLGLADQDGGYSEDMSEANSSGRVLSADVPAGADPSPAGRYLSAVPLDAGEEPELLVSWASGAVLPGDGVPSFGLYRFNSGTGAHELVYDDADGWETMARLLGEREEPPELAPVALSGQAVRIGGADVYTSSLFDFAGNGIKRIRVIEGFSTEEGFPNDFGHGPYEGAAMLGEADVYPDGSWLALVPPNVPLRLQAVDAFGMALASMPVWISGRPGETLFCGGCHEDRNQAPVSLGATIAAAIGPQDLTVAPTKLARSSNDYSADAVVGVPYDLSIQPILNAKCVSCHDFGQNIFAPWNMVLGDEQVTWPGLVLSGDVFSVTLGERDYSKGLPASYFTLLPPVDALSAGGAIITGDFKSYVEPGSARSSFLIQVLNPPSRTDTTQRAFATTPHAQAMGQELTADEYRLITLWIDLGAQFYSRENNPNP